MSSSESSNQTPMEFKFGDRVIAHLPEGKLCPAKIDRVLSSGLYSIVFPNGGRKIIDLAHLKPHPVNGSMTSRGTHDSDVIISCFCESTEDDGSLVQCENCLSWQHSECLDLNKNSADPVKPPCPACMETKDVQGTRRSDYNRWLGKLLPDFDVLSEAEEQVRKESAVSYLLEAAMECIDMVNQLKAKLLLAEDPSVTVDDLDLQNRTELLNRIATELAEKDSPTSSDDPGGAKPAKTKVCFGDGYRKNLHEHLEDMRSRLDLRLDYIETRIEELEEQYGPDFDPDEYGYDQSPIKTILKNLYANLESFKKIHCHIKRRRMNSDEHTSSSDDDYRQPRLKDPKAT